MVTDKRMTSFKEQARSGYFISLEGGEGAGKSTQLKLLVNWLENQGHSVVVTLEPGGTLIGKTIRSVLLDPNSKDLCPRAELLLYSADRAQHVETLILPSLKQGKVVISDRFCDSSTVYQGICRGLGKKWTETLNDFATSGLMPDTTIFLDIPQDQGMARVKQRLRQDMKLKGIRRRVKLDRLESQPSEFHRRVRAGFKKLARENPKRFLVVNACQTPEKVASDIQAALMLRLKK